MSKAYRRIECGDCGNRHVMGAVFPAALHIDHAYAATTEFGRPLMNSLFTLGLLIGLSVQDTTFGTTVANLGMSDASKLDLELRMPLLSCIRPAGVSLLQSRALRQRHLLHGSVEHQRSANHFGRKGRASPCDHQPPRP